MPSHSRSRDRYPGAERDRARERDRERDRERRRERDRERENVRGRYDDGGEGEISTPNNVRGDRYHFRGESGYDSYEYVQRDESDGHYESERRRERRQRRRQRGDEHLYEEPPLDARRRDRSKAKESPATSPIKKRDRERDRGGQRRRREYEDEGSPTKDVRERRHRSRGEERERSGGVDADARRRRRRERERERERDRERETEAAAAAAASRKHQSTESTNSASNLLSADALARLTSEYEEEDRRERPRAHEEARKERRHRKRAALKETGGELRADLPEGRSRSRHKSSARVVSGPFLEEGRGAEMKFRRRGAGGPGTGARWNKEGPWIDGSDAGDEGPPVWKFWSSWSRKKGICIGSLVVMVLLLAIIIPVAVVVSKKHGGKPSSTSSSSSASPSSGPTSNLNSISRSSIPAYAKGTVLDPFTWYDTQGFNLTFTNETVGGLYIMGLNSTWDDSARPNDQVPPLTERFPYGERPMRGVNLGGWLSIEPFITPSLFDAYSLGAGVVDEWTLTQQLGSTAATTIEKHYATFITEQDFAEIQQAGLDHVRIQYSFWAVRTWDGQPYVPKIAWRYLLRAIEYCRKYGLRVKLDLHGIPGSQNGWNHSGHQGMIGWINGTYGELNRQHSLEIHNQLSQFFAQDRYKNVVTLYGLVNEPLMLDLPIADVLNWNEEAATLVRKNGVTATIVFHDGFLDLSKWKNMFKTHPRNMYLDTHQYTTFNTGEIILNHTAKVELICSSWYPMIQQVNSTTEGWGPTMCGEWSQADTDCTMYLNNVGRGTRWEGTYSLTSSTAYCPTAETGPPCNCGDANAPVSEYSSTYKQFLQTYAEAQMSVFETAMGWFYWTWRTESAAQWSYRTAWKNGFMPEKAYTPSFKCGDTVPDFSSLGLPEYY